MSIVFGLWIPLPSVNSFLFFLTSSQGTLSLSPAFSEKCTCVIQLHGHSLDQISLHMWNINFKLNLLMIVLKHQNDRERNITKTHHLDFKNIRFGRISSTFFLKKSILQMHSKLLLFPSKLIFFSLTFQRKLQPLGWTVYSHLGFIFLLHMRVLYFYVLKCVYIVWCGLYLPVTCFVPSYF